MSIREKLIDFQNQAEANFEEKKSFNNGIRYAFAFLLFMSSTLWATFTIPFRWLRKGLSNHKRPASIVKLTKENQDHLLTKEPLVLLDFWAEWCGPCIMMDPLLDQFAEQAEGICIAKVNADVNPKLIKQFKIRGIPQFILLQHGKEVKRHAGPMTLNDLQAFCFE